MQSVEVAGIPLKIVACRQLNSTLSPEKRSGRLRRSDPETGENMWLSKLCGKSNKEHALDSWTYLVLPRRPRLQFTLKVMACAVKASGFWDPF